MSERGCRKVLPGSLVRMKLEIRHAPMHLREARVAFRHVGAGGRLAGRAPIIDELHASGEPRDCTPLGSSSVGVSSVTLALEISEQDVPGVFKLSRVWVKTYGGRTYHYEGEALECPVEAIYPEDEVPEKMESYITKAARFDFSEVEPA
jgi:hypothetical protein